MSEADAEALRSLHRDAEIVVAPNGVDTAYFRPGDPSAVDGDLLVFTGKMDFRPNVDAVRWFCEMVWPRLHSARPSTRFAIVGRDPSPAVKALTEIPGVLVTGLVQDVRPWVARAGAVVAPLRVGGGTRLKILEAMAMAKPIVATTMAVDGLNVEAGEDLLIADDPAEMTEAILSVLSDPERAESLGRSARRRAEFEYRWEKVGWEIEALYRDAAI